VSYVITLMQELRIALTISFYYSLFGDSLRSLDLPAYYLWGSSSFSYSRRRTELLKACLLFEGIFPRFLRGTLIISKLDLRSRRSRLTSEGRVDSFGLGLARGVVIGLDCFSDGLERKQSNLLY
jgi:hypothetical protein